MTVEHTTDAIAWAARADELAHWAMSRLVNRSNSWGAYTPRERRGQVYNRRDGVQAKVPVNYTAKGILTPELLARHFRGRRAEDVIGLHSTSLENTSLWGAVDLDRHGPTSTAPAVNLAAALAWYGRLRGMGFVPLLTDSNGAGGYHLRFLLAEPVATPRVFGFLKSLTSDHARLGLAATPETFPKQARIEPGKYGNWLRLPGRHHTREHWSSVWDGACWLAGADAMAFLPALRGDDPRLIPAEVVVTSTCAPTRAVPPSASSFSPAPLAGQLDRRISAYIAKLPGGLGEGQHRDDHAYTLACFLVRDLALGDADALPWMELWDGRNAVPKGTDRLHELLKSARKYGQHSYGNGLQRPPFRRGKHHLTHVRFTVEI